MGGHVKCSGKLLGLLGFLLCPGQAQVTQTTPIQPTPLEAFAKQPASHIAWSSEAGHIDSREAHAVITALVVEDSAQPPDRLRGIRIDLSDEDAKDQVYLGEETLPAFKNAMDDISRDAAHGCEWNAGGVCPPNIYVGSCLFRYLDKVPNVHTLTAAHYFRQGSTGLSLGVIGLGKFQFPDQDASQLSAAISRAMEQLKQR
jgi:hypothetical protein